MQFEDHAVVAKYLPTGEEYGVGSPGSETSVIEIHEGDAGEVHANPNDHWARFEFDLPTDLPLNDSPFDIPFENTTMKVRLKSQKRGDEMWSSLDTTSLPRFTRVSIKAVPAFSPYRTLDAARVVAHNVSLLLMVTGHQRLDADGMRLSLRANFYRSGALPPKLIAKTTVPLTGLITYPMHEAVPITPEVLERLSAIRDELVTFVTTQSRDESFPEQVRRATHDFGYFCRQHPESLGLLNEEVLRDLELVPMKVLFGAEGEAVNMAGKTDIKVSNPTNR